MTEAMKGVTCRLHEVKVRGGRPRLDAFPIESVDFENSCLLFGFIVGRAQSPRAEWFMCLYCFLTCAIGKVGYSARFHSEKILLLHC